MSCLIKPLDIILQIVFWGFAILCLLPNFKLEYLDSITILTTLLTAIFVQFIKGIRLYIALYGNKVNLLEYMITYCKVTPVNIVLPFKLGELYRIYCFGKLLSNGMKGLVIILLDRFVDTLALVIIILLFQVMTGNRLSSFILVLFTFLMMLTFVFIAFIDIYNFWNGYLLRLDASSHRLKGLKVLQQCKKIYDEIVHVVRGRGIILLFLSFLSWTVEIGLLIVLGVFKLKFDIFELYTVTLNYLKSAVFENKSIEMVNFIVISFVILFISYYLLLGIRKIKGNNYEN